MKNTLTCPSCKEQLNENDIAYGQKGMKYFDIIIEKDRIDYQEDEFEVDENGTLFWCKVCLKHLATNEKDFIKLLKD